MIHRRRVELQAPRALMCERNKRTGFGAFMVVASSLIHEVRPVSTFYYVRVQHG